MEINNAVSPYDRREKSVINLRRFARKPFRRATIFACQDRYFSGIITNISKGGLFIETRNYFLPGQIVKLVISRTKMEKGVMLTGEVVHLRREGFGLKFLSLLKDRKEYHIKQ